MRRQKELDLHNKVVLITAAFVQTELVDIRVRDHGLDNAPAVPMAVPARMMVYFAACEDPIEYSGRLYLRRARTRSFADRA